MRVISTRAHGVIDYLSGGMLLSAPSLLGLTEVPASARVFRLAGGGAALYSLLTDYELGLFKVLPMPVHLALDAANGALLAASPWLFGFAEEVSAPHLGLGLFEIVVTASSQATPARAADPGARPSL